MQYQRQQLFALAWSNRGSYIIYRIIYQTQMEKICKKACMDKLPYFKSTKYDDDGEFFELNAKRWNGSSLDFERFIGFITLIINVPVTCQDSAGEKDNLLRDFNRLMKITPRSSIEYVLFPVISGDHQCDDEKLRAIFADIDANKNVQMMEALASSDEFSTHPVYQYLMTITGIKEIGNDISTIMSINPMGSQIDVLEGQTHEKVKRYSVENLQTWEL